MKLKLTNLFLFSFMCFQSVDAQEWMLIQHHYKGVEWNIPLQMDKYTMWEFSDDKKTLNASAILKDSTLMTVPFSLENVDSISFVNDIADEEKGHFKYRPFTMHITTQDYANIVEREVWLNCHISIDGMGEYSNYSGTGRIRGRGNSSWDWYDKKPYKFKLDEKSKLLGLNKAKNWNLLANYRDVTDLMNVHAFEVARTMGMPYTNHSRFVEVFLNDDYIGTYQLTEKIEVGENRVEIDEDEGVVLSFDLDDGPSLSPEADDNFWSAVYKLPMCVKHPEDPTEEQIAAIMADFKQVEEAVKARDYNKLSELMDIPSFISMLQLHEYLYNVEIDAPRSMYMFKDKDGKYTFGPVWDWDAAFDFDWSDMYTGHRYFDSYTELIMGTDPVKGTNAAYNINKFWRNMFGNATFVKQYKEAWTTVSDKLNNIWWDETYKYSLGMKNAGTYSRDTEKWPLLDSKASGWWGASASYFDVDTEVSKMQNWLTMRKNNLDNVIANYPDGNDESVDPNDIEIVATITKEQSCKYSSGYRQSGQISIDKSKVEGALGGTPSELVPLNADGSEGNNTAAGTYGAWFDDDGTQGWGGGAHVYIESDDLYTWSYGCHPDNCSKRDKHTVTMQYRRGKKAVNVVVTFVLS